LEHPTNNAGMIAATHKRELIFFFIFFILNVIYTLVHADGCLVTSHKKNLFAKVGLPSNSSHRRFKSSKFQQSRYYQEYNSWHCCTNNPQPFPSTGFNRIVMYTCLPAGR
jgi:hypothetical protein